jgi:hypothetical protein
LLAVLGLAAAQTAPATGAAATKSTTHKDHRCGRASSFASTARYTPAGKRICKCGLPLSRTAPRVRVFVSQLARSSPFTAFTKSLPQEKKKPFMELMKRLRTAKAASIGTKEEKKKATTSLDVDIHKLLGADYKRYRSVQHAQKELHAAHKAGNKSGSPSTKTVVTPPAPAAAAAPTPGAKKKSSKLPGAGSKKKAAAKTTS